ncbi:hypothetical protein IQ07DRAFT_34060 [Pyrenochaeta sp. DS3sAY3a]|nr:hypothetical protein IQ07DRAFT_34060 [Pyrenochaeta sp. DS3sAY3a]
MALGKTIYGFRGIFLGAHKDSKWGMRLRVRSRIWAQEEQKELLGGQRRVRGGSVWIPNARFDEKSFKRGLGFFRISFPLPCTTTSTDVIFEAASSIFVLSCIFFSSDPYSYTISFLFPASCLSAPRSLQLPTHFLHLTDSWPRHLHKFCIFSCLLFFVSSRKQHSV